MNRRHHQDTPYRPSGDPFKYKKGERRSPRLDQWYADQKAHAHTQRHFASHKKGVPNNPANLAGYGGPEDVVHHHNPYGDADQVRQQEGPQLTTPDQQGRWFNTPDINPAAAVQTNEVGFGIGSMAMKDIEAKGMNTGMSPLGSGPQRNVKRSKKNK